jgi:guanyl-specific ribonuclease Sa
MRIDPSGLADKEATGINAAIKALTGEKDPHSPVPGEGRWPACPPKAKQMVSDIGANNGEPLPGYFGGRPYENDGRGGTQVLPRGDLNGNPIKYREYDVNPFIGPKLRGKERVVIGSDGNAYYTSDHYFNFVPVK